MSLADFFEEVRKRELKMLAARHPLAAEFQHFIDRWYEDTRKYIHQKAASFSDEQLVEICQSGQADSRYEECMFFAVEILRTRKPKFFDATANENGRYTPAFINGYLLAKDEGDSAPEPTFKIPMPTFKK